MTSRETESRQLAPENSKFRYFSQEKVQHYLSGLAKQQNNQEDFKKRKNRFRIQNRRMTRLLSDKILKCIFMFTFIIQVLYDIIELN